jgi:hypothetical protein
MAGRGRSYSGARAAYGDYQSYPEGRPIFLPEAERFGNPPDLPSLLLQQRVIYISMPVRIMERCLFYCSSSGSAAMSCRRGVCFDVKPATGTACGAATCFRQQLHGACVAGE